MTYKEHYAAVIRESETVISLLEERMRHAFSEEEHERFRTIREAYKQTVATYEGKLAGINDEL